MASVSECSLCGKVWNDRQEYLNHLSNFHRIQRPQDFAEVVENLPQANKDDSDDTGHHPQCWKFKVGDLVMARLGGFPYWPGIVDKCPEMSLNRTQLYAIRFFEETRTTIGNVEEKYIRRYDNNDDGHAWNQKQLSKKLPAAMDRRLNAAIDWAKYVLDWSANDRLSYFKNPELFQSVQDNTSANLSNVQEGSNNVRLIDAKGRHWRTIKFKCLSCHFTTHLSSVLEKHQQRNRNHRMEKQQMSIRLRGTRWKFKVGDLVMAKLDGFPYWPGIVDKCPSSESIYDMLVKRRYVVRFFDQKVTTIGNVQEKYIRRYDNNEDGQDRNQKQLFKKLPAATDRRLNAAIDWAKYVLDWSANDRLSYFKNPELYQSDQDSTSAAKEQDEKQSLQQFTTQIGNY